MYSKESTKNKIQEILNQHNLNINIITENKDHDISYSKKDNAIKFNQYMLFELYNKFAKFEPEEVLSVAVYHEIGHYLFYQRQEIIEIDRKTKELYAWEYGRGLIPTSLLPTYLEIEKVICL